MLSMVSVLVLLVHACQAYVCKDVDAILSFRSAE